MDSIRLERRPVHHQIAEHLQRMILQSQFAPGEALPGERDLAAHFKVSRNSLRQAIAYLEALGLVEIRHGAGVFVLPMQDEAAVNRMADVLLDPDRSLVDVVEARLMIEPSTVALAAERRTTEDLDDLERYVPMDGSVPEVTPGNFHPRLIGAAHNEVIARLYRTLTTGPGSVWRLLERFPEAKQEWEVAHRSLFEAVRDRDQDAASRLMTEHLVQVIDLAKIFVAEESST